MATVSPPQPPTPAPAWTYALHLPHDPRSPRIARATLRTVLSAHGLSVLNDVAELLTSELVTNAYRHSRGPAALRLRELDGGRGLRVTVWDTDAHIPPPFDRGERGRCGALRPVPPTPAGEADGGRGLFLVCHYAHAWGGYLLGDDLFGRGGKLLWFELGAGRPGEWAVAA
ncbi:ATP-binding protein [Streptomyces lasiicapitis]|uniref:ATP-binding protein n=1 Tax=Streptomyces lasiicapitis TaxID=1923961 RepID=A0ABQ2LI92_9ACTN|nr:ATP-binding protein [Streptomyces lasiicapitis]GGO35025.1 ATP-binding protein [Streptomyces lasiicapitis]